MQIKYGIEHNAVHYFAIIQPVRFSFIHFKVDLALHLASILNFSEIKEYTTII